VQDKESISAASMQNLVLMLVDVSGARFQNRSGFNETKNEIESEDNEVNNIF